MTVAGVVFALLGRFGLDGFLERLSAAMVVASIFAPLAEFHFRWKREQEYGW